MGANKMTNENKVKELQALGKTPKCSEVAKALMRMGDFKGDYDKILDGLDGKWKADGPSIFDIAVSEYLEAGNYNELAALMTFLTREDDGDPGAFAGRAKKGEIKKVIDRMIQLLQSGNSTAARDRMISKQ